MAASLAEPRNMIMVLYNGGAHLDFRSRDTLTPMHKAAIIGNDKALKSLLELGAFADVRDGRSLTPLYYSIVNSSSIQSIEYLLFNGSPIGSCDDNNWQEIHHCCKLGLTQHLDHLIYYGCDINAKNNSGNTPLHVCAIHNQESCARTLLFRGCNRNERNLANQTAYDSAVIAGNGLVADLIKNHRDSDTVLIKERPFYNTKRRSIYVMDTQSSNYSMNQYSSINSATFNCQRKPSLTDSNTTNGTIVEWNDKQAAMGGTLTTTATHDECGGVMRTRSMPKLEPQASSGSLYAVTSATMIGISSMDGSMPPPPPPPAMQTSPVNNPSQHNHNHLLNSGSSSPTSRSRSISSDDHGFGSASLSQLSNGSPNMVEYAYPRKRLYPSIPNRTFLCVKSYKPTQQGEIELKKGDIIELLSVGDSGFWEGRLMNGQPGSHTEGWFRADCVEEFSLPKDGSSQCDSIVVKRKTLFDLITHSDLNAPRTVVLQRGKKGFGFVLRGAKSKRPKPQLKDFTSTNIQNLFP
jgi:SH3/ankyrin repeat-containing protein